MATTYAPARDFHAWMQAQNQRPTVAIAKESGWNLQHTGGGCLAFEKQIEGKDFTVMITSESDIPNSADEKCAVGYWTEIDGKEITEYIECANLAEAMERGDKLVKKLTP